jgi:hypothetical protein
MGYVQKQLQFVKVSGDRSGHSSFLSCIRIPVARGYQIEGNVFQANTQRKALRLGKPVRLVHNPEHQIIRFLVQSQFAHLASPVICRRVWSQPVPPVAARPCCRVWSQPAPPVAARPCCRVWSQPVPPVAARPCCRARCRPAAPVPGLSGILFHDPDSRRTSHHQPKAIVVGRDDRVVPVPVGDAQVVGVVDPGTPAQDAGRTSSRTFRIATR